MFSLDTTSTLTTNNIFYFIYSSLSPIGSYRLCLVVQIVTGLFLAIHYTAHIDLAFSSVAHICRDVNYGYSNSFSRLCFTLRSNIFEVQQLLLTFFLLSLILGLNLYNEFEVDLQHIDKVPFHPYFTFKDVVGFIVILTALILLTLLNPYLLGDPDNFVPANPLVTPAHIQPE
ncbi:Cytochrome b-like, partial [Homarus americanus]